jgi:hypothetical protein
MRECRYRGSLATIVSTNKNCCFVAEIDSHRFKFSKARDLYEFYLHLVFGPRGRTRLRF